MRFLVTGTSEQSEVTHVAAPAGLVSRLEARLRSLTYRQKIAVLVLTAVLIYGGFIAADGLAVRPWLDANFGPSPDLPYYQERTKLILNGGMIYRDLDIESPPLINYILLPPQLIGGDWWAYEIYFSMFPLLISLSMYTVMRRWDDHYAFLAAWIFVACPYAVQDATWGIQDDPMVAFFYLLPIFMFLHKYRRSSGAVTAIGFWTKFLPVIQYPVLLIRMKDNRERLISLGWTIGASLIIMVPFLLLAPIEFLHFPSYYLLGRSGESGAGMSIIYLISQNIVYIDGTIGAALTVVALLASYYLVYRWRLDVWRGAMLTTVMFLTVYPMIHLNYFILPFAFFMIWAVRDKWIIARIALMYFLLLFSQGFAEVTAQPLQFPGAWLLALVLAAAGTLVMLDITRICLKSRSFLDHESEEKVEGAPVSA